MKKKQQSLFKNGFDLDYTENVGSNIVVGEAKQQPL
jgi:hypothetical protein